MKILIIPMSAMAETAGSFSRSKNLAYSLSKQGFDTAVCVAKDMNYKPLNGIREYDMSTPMPLGLPKWLAVHTFPIAQKSGITSRKTVRSFEEVLHLTGNLDYEYLKKNIEEIRKVIREFKPDVLYSEFNLSAIIAAKVEGVVLYSTASVPTQANYSSSPQYACGVQKILEELHLPKVKSSLELFSWSDCRFVPSCTELEPSLEKDGVIFCGTWKRKTIMSSPNKNKIVVYMGNGTISKKKMIREIKGAFMNSKYEIYIAGKGMVEHTYGNIHMASYFDFDELLSSAVLFIHHGGQNSMIDGLIYGVPQLICAGKVFERKYNAKSIETNHAGKEISYKDFTADKISQSAKEILTDIQYQKHAEHLGEILLGLGGTKQVIKELQNYSMIPPQRIVPF